MRPLALLCLSVRVKPSMHAGFRHPDVHDVELFSPPLRDLIELLPALEKNIDSPGLRWDIAYLIDFAELPATLDELQFAYSHKLSS
jgi:hypothetical protein